MSTTSMNISLPSKLRAFIEECLAKDGYGTASEYIRELVRADQKRRAEQELENLLLERLRNEKVEEFDVDRLKSELGKRMKK